MAFESERERVAMALESAHRLLPEVRTAEPTPDADLWILAHGFSNAFYAVLDRIRKTDNNDPLAWELAKAWRVKNSFLLEDYVVRFRNALTHKDQFRLTSVSAPVRASEEEGYVVHMTSYAPPGMTMRNFTMTEWIIYVFEWLRDELAELASAHEAGGSPHPASQGDEWSTEGW